MPKRTDLRKILIIGSGPIVIGQACEFDYSGTQALKALREEGFEVVLVNSNPATIMTDPELAQRTYVEPLTPEVVAKIIERERARRGRHARALRRRADRGQAPRDPEGRGPPALQAGDGAHRPGTAALRVRAEPRRGAHDRPPGRLPGDYPALVHARRHGGLDRLRPGGARGGGPLGAPDVACLDRARRGVGDRLEGVRARGDARSRR